jgi:hypothetical protein
MMAPPPHQAPAARQAQARLGWRPLRHPQIPPTDRDEADPTRINLNAEPQGSVKVWAGDASHYFFNFGWILLGMDGLMTFAACLSPVRPLLIVSGVLGFPVICGLMFWARSVGFQRLRLGVDWAQNVLWLNVDGRTHLSPDATCIQDFTIFTRTRTGTRGSGLKRQKYTYETYLLGLVMSDGKTATLLGMPETSKGKANEALQMARGLLARMS